MDHFGKYQLLRRLGSGGMAEVFLARTAVAEGLTKDLVIKKIRPAYARYREFVSMFVTEAKIALGLNHPNIVQVFDFGTAGDTFFLAMEYVAGIDLLHLMREARKRKHAIPLSLCAYIVQEIAKGLDYAHRKTDDYGEPLGIVHRDVSPHNVLVSWEGAVKLVDFGIARARGIEEQDRGIKGKYSYMSPEHARGETVDRRADVYSAGVVLFELCCGRQLFPGQGTRVLDRVVTGAYPRPSDVNPNIPADLEQTILKALSFHRDDRFATARQLQLALGEFLFHQADTASELSGSEDLADFVADLIGHSDTTGPFAHPSVDDMRGDTEGGSRELADVVSGDQNTALLDAFDPDAPDHSPSGPRTKLRERKHVVVVEARLGGRRELADRLGSDRVARIVTAFIGAVRDIAFKHHGYVHKMSNTGVSIVLGLPLASEDDASRAVRLGFALIDALDGIGGDLDPPLSLSLGVQRSMAVITRDGQASGGVQVALDDRLLAARLSEHAEPGQILVGSQIYRMAQRSWHFDERAPVNLLGAKYDALDSITHPSEPTPQLARAYRLTGAKERRVRLREEAARVGQLYGRDLELKALRDAYRHVLTTRRKRAVVLAGEAGIGKRTLVNAFLADIPAGAALILRATPQVNRAFTPYAVLADVVRDVLGLTEESNADELHARLEHLAPILYGDRGDSEFIHRDLRAMARVLGIDAAEAAAITSDLDPGEFRQRIIQLIARFELNAAPEKPLIVVCEEIHWADDESLDVLGEHLANPGQRPLLAILTARPDPRVNRFATDIAADVVGLGELDIASTMQLIAQHLGRQQRFAVDTNAVAELARQVRGCAGGNPFFVCEMIDSLVDRGELVTEQGDVGAQAAGSTPAGGTLRWVARDPLVAVPSSVEALLSTRIDHLPEREKECLLCAALLGRMVRPETLNALVARAADSDLMALAERGFLRRQDDHYAFHNELCMAVACELLPDEERIRLHRRAATIIAEAPGYRAGADDAAVAVHLEQAGDRDEAADRYLAAALHAVDVGGNSDALRQLTRALDLLSEDDHARRFAVHGQRQEVLRRLARRGPQESEIVKMREQAVKLGDPAKIALAETRLAEYSIDMGQTRAASSAVDEALARARQAHDSLAEAKALELAAHIAQRTESGEEAIRLCEQALTLCDDSREGKRRRAALLNTRGRASWSIGGLEDAVASFADALALYRNLGLPRKEAVVLNDMGTVCAAMGELEEALRYHKNALKLDQKLGDRVGFAGKLSNIGEAYLEIGDVARAQRYLHKAIKLAEQVGDEATTAKAVISLGRVYWLCGEHKRASIVLKHGVELTRNGHARYQEVRARLYLVLSELESGGDAQQCLLSARAVTELAATTAMPMGRVFGLSAQGIALAQLGRAAEAADVSAQAVAEQAGQTRPERGEIVWYVHATLCEAAGRLDDAVRAIDQARREVELKAGRLQNRELHSIYVASKFPRAVLTFHEHIAGSAAAGSR